MALVTRLCRAAASRPSLIIASRPALLRPLGGGMFAQQHQQLQHPRGMAMEAFAASIQADTAWVQKIAAGGVGDSDASSTFVGVIEACSGRVLVTGIGKSGCVGRRMSVTQGWYPSCSRGRAAAGGGGGGTQPGMVSSVW
jgi:hypothetical protein